MTPLAPLLLFGLLQSPAPSAAPQAAVAPTPDVFVDNVLHISFKLPAAMHADPETIASTSQALLNTGGKSKAGLPCVSLPFVGLDDQDFRIAYVFRRAGDCPDRTDLTRPGETATNSFSGSLSGLGEALVGEPVLYKLNGHPAAVVRGRTLSKKIGVIYGVMSCVAFTKEMLCWEYLAGSKDVLNALTQTPVTLEGATLPVIPEASFQATTLPGQIYRSEAGHFELAFPGEMVRTDEQVQAAVKVAQEKADADTKEQSACISVPLSASENTPLGPASLIVLHADSVCLGVKLTSADLGEFAEGVVKGVSKTMRNEFRDAVQYKIAGHDAVLLRGSIFTASGHETAIAIACLALDGDVDCFQAIAPTQEMLSRLLDFPVKFDGYPAVAIASSQQK